KSFIGPVKGLIRLGEQRTQGQGIITRNIYLKGFCVNWLSKKYRPPAERFPMSPQDRRAVYESRRHGKSCEIELYTLQNSVLLSYISLTIGRSVGYITTKYAPRVFLSPDTKESHIGTQ